MNLSAGRILLKSDVGLERFEFEDFKIPENWNKIVFKFGDILENSSGFKGMVYAFEAFNAINIPTTKFELRNIKIDDVNFDDCTNEGCLESYHSDVKHEIRKLMSCDPNCNTCDNLGICSKCNDKYYLDQQNCFSCNPICATCSESSSHCDSCHENANLNTNNCECNAGYY